jgi:beta-1,4-mannosyl-glycoprotein beta-1,4-N-acetylglucosaminyltransferase
MNNKIIDCITFFNENLMFEIRYNILKDFVDYFIVCESKFDHRGNIKKLNFNIEKFKSDKIKYVVYEKKLSNYEDLWKNQAKQREFILQNLDFVDPEDYVFFSDPDEIPNTSILKNFNLKKKYGIFMQNCFNYKFNLFNSYESPWEGTRVCKKKNLKSIDFMRQKVKSKNLRYNFFRFDKEKSIELFSDGGWHFNNIMTSHDISKKLKTFAHSEFSSDKFSNPEIIEKKIESRKDLFERGHEYIKINLDVSFPEYIIKNKLNYSQWII